MEGGAGTGTGTGGGTLGIGEKPMSEKDLPVIDEYRAIGRREVLRQWVPPVFAGVALAGLGLGVSGRPGRHQPPSAEALPRPRDWRIDPAAEGRIATACGRGPTTNLHQALAALGGIEAFVKSGERVAIKPNCAWDARLSRPPTPIPS